jgi:integrase
MPSTVEREKGLWLNGNRWWLRVNKVPRSTGARKDDLIVANRVKRMVDELSESPKTAHWLDADVPLLDLYQHRSAGTLPLLAERLRAGAAAQADADLDPWVTTWEKEHLAVVGISEKQRQEYVRQVRVLIPEGRRFPKSRFTEDAVKKALGSLVEPRSGLPLTGSTRRRYFVAWKLFYRYARKRVPLDVNPFEDAEDWTPANNSSRTVYWDHATTLAVLAKMSGEPLFIMALIFGTGGELGTQDRGGVLKMEGRHIGPEPEDEHELPWVIIPGSKNQFREDRTVFVNRWAWAMIREHVQGIKPRQSLWSTLDIDGRGEDVRDAFYAAQVAAGVIEQPPKSARTGLPLWGRAEPHRIHDARHTYCYVRLLGDDGEPRQSVTFCSKQLGHGDEQMVMKIYAKANIEQRLRLIELREARKEKKT